MRGFELTAANQRLYLDVIRGRDYPVQVVWGAHDRMLPWRRYGTAAQRAAGDLVEPTLLSAKHFLEDCPAEIAAAVHRLIGTEAA